MQFVYISSIVVFNTGLCRSIGYTVYKDLYTTASCPFRCESLLLAQCEFRPGQKMSQLSFKKNLFKNIS